MKRKDPEMRNIPITILLFLTLGVSQAWADGTLPFGDGTLPFELSGETSAADLTVSFQADRLDFGSGLDALF